MYKQLAHTPQFCLDTHMQKSYKRVKSTGQMTSSASDLTGQEKHQSLVTYLNFSLWQQILEIPA